MTATSCESLFVVASRNTKAIAGRPTQSSLSTALTSPFGTAAAGGTTGAAGSIGRIGSVAVEVVAKSAGVDDGSGASTGAVAGAGATIATGAFAFFQTRNAQ